MSERRERRGLRGARAGLCRFLASFLCCVPIGERAARADTPAPDTTPATGATDATPVTDATAPTAPTGARSTVEIVVTGESRISENLDVLVHELVANLPVDLAWSVSPSFDPRDVLARRADDRRVLARTWVDLSDTKRARIYVANAGSERFIVRSVPEQHGYDAVACEALGQIIASSIAAFVARSDAGIPREDAVLEVEGSLLCVEPPPVEPSPARSAPPRIHVGLAYQAAYLSDSILQNEAALVVGLSVPSRASLRFASWASVAYRLPARFEGPSVGVALSGVSFRLAAGVEGDLDRRSRFQVAALAGVGVDTVSIEPFTVSEATSAASPTQAVAPLVTLTSIFRSRLVGSFALLWGIGGEVDLSRPRYVVAHDDARTPAFVPSTVRLTALVGAQFAFGGPDR